MNFRFFFNFVRSTLTTGTGIEQGEISVSIESRWKCPQNQSQLPESEVEDKLEGWVI